MKLDELITILQEYQTEGCGNLDICVYDEPIVDVIKFWISGTDDEFISIRACKEKFDII